LAELEKKTPEWDQRYRELGEQIRLTPDPERQALIEECIRIDQERKEAPRREEESLAALETLLEQIGQPELVAAAFYPQDILDAPAFDLPLCWGRRDGLRVRRWGLAGAKKKSRPDYRAAFLLAHCPFASRRLFLHITSLCGTI